MELRAKIKRWWDGETVSYENDPSSPVTVIAWWIRRHWTSRACHAVVDYVRSHHWQIIMAAVAIAGVIVHAMK